VKGAAKFFAFGKLQVDIVCLTIIFGYLFKAGKYCKKTNAQCFLRKCLSFSCIDRRRGTYFKRLKGINWVTTTKCCSAHVPFLEENL